MDYIELLLIAIGLSMDAFAASISKGLCLAKIKYRYALIIAFFFGGFQFLMPILGWLLAKSFATYIVNIDHWIAFILLAFIGGKMIIEALQKHDIECCSTNLIDVKNLFFLAVATSIDALAVGVTFALLPDINIALSVVTIGCTTFILSFIGVFIGHSFGVKFGKWSEIIGGTILIAIGLKILVDHLGLIAF